MVKAITGLVMVIVVALWSVWPMIVKPDRVADFGKDGMYLAAIQMNWHQKFSDYIRHMTDSRTSLFDGYFFYAEKNSLAYSDMLFVTSLSTYWMSKFVRIPAAGAGLALVGGQVLLMIISYGVFTKMSRSVWGGLVGSVAFGLSQIHFMYQVHMHTWIMTLWLLSYWLFTKKRYLLSGLFLGLQMWESPLGVYFALLAIIIYLTCYQLPIKLLIKNLLFFSIAFGVVAFLPAKAYWEVSNHYHYVRTIRDAAYHGLSINNFDGFVSSGLFILFIGSIIFNFKFLIFKQFSNIKFLIILIIISYILALGPVLKWDNKTIKLGKMFVPLPYAIAYYSVPGWQAFRVPSRWMVLAGWGAAGLIACGITNKLNIKKLIGFTGCLAVAVLGGTKITRFADLPRQIPGEYLTNEEVLVFKPMGGEPEEIERMYFSIMAGKKTMNGFSGFLPPGRVKWLNEK